MAPKPNAFRGRGRGLLIQEPVGEDLGVQPTFFHHTSLLGADVASILAEASPTVVSQLDIKPVKKITVIHCWTAPRSRSTALTYSFEARGEDCVALDEPLKREWLIYQGDRVQRPYKENMIAGTAPADKPEDAHLWERETLSLGERIHQAALKIASSSNTSNESGVIFCKHMSKTYFLYDFDNEVFVEPIAGVELEHKHMFLLRDPVAILQSWDVKSAIHQEACEPEDVGIVPLVSIYTKLLKRYDGLYKPTILDSDALVADPEGVLQDVCRQMNIPYTSNMMTWKAGNHDCDSRHAPWWYGDAHSSTGWILNHHKQSGSHQKKKSKPLNPKLLPALKESYPAYEMLMNVHKSPTSAEDNAIMTMWWHAWAHYNDMMTKNKYSELKLCGKEGFYCEGCNLQSETNLVNTCTEISRHDIKQSKTDITNNTKKSY